MNQNGAALNLIDPTSLMYIASERHRSLIERAAADLVAREARQVARARRRARRSRIRRASLSTPPVPRPFPPVPASSPATTVEALVAVRIFEAVSS